jgi:methylthioribose-1-phosphate isomerase
VRVALGLRLSHAGPDRPGPTQPGDRRALAWRGDHLEIVDQRLLPGRLELRALRSAGDVVDAIATLAVRGAPAIGVSGAFGVVLGLAEHPAPSRDEVLAQLDALVPALGGARPTAVNLAWAVNRVADAAREAGTPAAMRAAALAEALRIRDADEDSCHRIGELGAGELAGASRLLTHCNAGWLATAGSGTALGIVYAKAAAGHPVEVLVCETRPMLQGARLTAWELDASGIPVTLIADGAAGAAMRNGQVDAVVVGCDRVARNGDTANKIGTYALAVLAEAHGIPFYVAGPMTSFDEHAADGAAINIEQRSPDEVRRAGGSLVAPDVAVWNPAFDVTPASLITAFVTDAGVLRPPYEDSITEGLAKAAREGLG